MITLRVDEKSPESIRQAMFRLSTVLVRMPLSETISGRDPRWTSTPLEPGSESTPMTDAQFLEWCRAVQAHRDPKHWELLKLAFCQNGTSSRETVRKVHGKRREDQLRKFSDPYSTKLAKVLGVETIDREQWPFAAQYASSSHTRATSFVVRPDLQEMAMKLFRITPKMNPDLIDDYLDVL